MELVSCETGQALQLINMDEIRPVRGGVFLPDILSNIKERYRFQSFVPRTDQTNAIKFDLGVAKLEELTIPISSIEIYNDGIAVNARHTDDADAVMDDFLKWSSESYDFREPQHVIPRRHQSRIIVDIDRSAGDLFFKNFKLLNSIVGGSLGSEKSSEVTQIMFGPHPPGEYPFLHTWLFQPRIGQPHVPNRYFSAAPLSTSAHVDMLSRLEAAVKQR